VSIFERAKAALTGDLRADELDELAVELRININEKGDRIKSITAKDKSTFGGNPGPERQKAVDSGDLDTIKAMDKEEHELNAELVVLRSLQKRLRAHLDATRAHEFVESAPARYSELAKLLAAEAKAQAALQNARKATAIALRGLSAQRQHCARPNTPILEFPAADDTLLRQLMQVRGYTYHRSPVRVGWFSPTDGPQQLRIVAGALGLALPHPAAMAAA
jgi:multidrug efflux pump subunit AcrA (membrane-fusion protein)